MDDTSDVASFYSLSSELTGFDCFDLLSTGQGETYFAAARARIGPDTFAALLGTWDEIARDVPPAERETAVAARIFGVEGLREAAQRLLLLWYTGSWYNIFPDGAAFAQDAPILSARSYVEGLMWRAAGTHPTGAKPQGYAAWALPPPQRS